MAKQRITLTESQLNRVIKESVKRVLKEEDTQTLSIRPNYGGAFDTIDNMLNKALDLQNMLQELTYKDTAYGTLAMAHGELEDNLSRFIGTLKQVKQQTKVASYK